MAEYIDRKALPLKEFIKTAQLFQDDIVCAIGTDFMQKIAEAENKELFKIIKAVQNASTIKAVERERGEWKYNFGEYPSRYDVHIICTNCGHIFARLTGVDFNFCPHCGADMRKEDNNG